MNQNLNKDKIKELNQKIAYLENYNRLCERRIRQLCPSHPLPITQEHMDISAEEFQAINESNQQINQYKEYIKNLKTMMENKDIVLMFIYDKDYC